MSMKSSHRDAFCCAPDGASPSGASPVPGFPSVDSLMLAAPMWVREKVRRRVRRRNATARTIRFAAVSVPSSTVTHPPSRRLIWLLTVASGASVANLYYNQPLLSDIARTFHASSRATGAIATLTQAGYAVGLLLFVPLGDVVERRRLIVTLLVCVTGA